MIECYLNYELTKVKVKALKDHPEINFLGYKYGPLIKDKEIEIPRALARLLAEEGLTEFPKPNISVSDLEKRHYQEVFDKLEIKELENDFYMQARDLLYMAERNMIKEDPKKIRGILEELCTKRLEKILRSIVLIEDHKRIFSSLTVEERHLAISVKELIKTWKEDVLYGGFLRKI